MFENGESPVLISTAEAAKMLGVTQQHLANRRNLGTEKFRYVKLGNAKSSKVMYYFDDIAEFINKCAEEQGVNIRINKSYLSREEN